MCHWIKNDSVFPLQTTLTRLIIQFFHYSSSSRKLNGGKKWKTTNNFSFKHRKGKTIKENYSYTVCCTIDKIILHYYLFVLVVGAAAFPSKRWVRCFAVYHIPCKTNCRSTSFCLLPGDMTNWIWPWKIYWTQSAKMCICVKNYRFSSHLIQYYRTTRKHIDFHII